MTPMRVGLSTSTVQAARLMRGVDGIGVYTQHLREALPSLGIDVRGWFFPDAAMTRLPGPGSPFPGSFAARSVAGLIGLRLDMASEVDVFHVTDYRVVRMNCPVVVTLHDAVPLSHPEWTSARFRWVKNFQFRRSGRYADGVIALSRAAVPELVEHFGIEEERISVVPCGVDPDWFEAVDSAAVDAELAARGLAPGYFLFVGTLQPRKNVGRILDAYLALPEAIRAARQLVIVGRPGWHCEEEAFRLRAAMVAGQSIVWIDNLSDRDALRRIFAGAGVFVFPSLHEGFGIPILEAFASGIPVVTSNMSSLPEVAGDAAVLVDPFDVASISDGMARLADDPTLRLACIGRGRDRARILSWENTARLTVEVYRRFA